MVRSVFRSRVVAVSAGALLVVGLGAGTAVAHGMIGSDDIRRGAVEKRHIAAGAVDRSELANQSVGSPQLANGGVRQEDLSGFVANELDDREEFNGVRQRLDQLETTVEEESGSGVEGLESDGPYPGATDLGDFEGQGDNSDARWVNDGSLQRSWVMCAPGKVALGGGFTLAADASLQDKLATQVVTSQPVQVVDGNPDAYNPIEGDPAGSYEPNGWLVEGVYTGTNPDGVVVRPHVVCAEVEDTDTADPEEPEGE